MPVIDLAVQTLELAAVYTLVGVAIYLLRARLAKLEEAPIGWRLAVGFAVGALIALFMFVKGVDVLSDGLEPVALAGLLTAVVVIILVLVLRARR